MLSNHKTTVSEYLEKQNNVADCLPSIPPPTITCPPSPVTEGASSVKLLCDDGNTSMAKQWTRDGQPMVPISCFFSLGTLTAQRASAALSCASVSLPPATFTWEIRGVLVGRADQYVTAELEEEHLGNYTCTATNAPTGVVVSTVYTLNALAISPGHTALGRGPLTGVTGGRVTFEPNLSLTDLVNTTGPPFRSIVWLFNLGNIVLYTPAGSLIAPAYRKRIRLSTTSGSLELWGLTVRDSGTYTVDITTHTDQQVNGSTSLNVYVPVSKVVVTPNATDLLEFSSSVSLSCSVSTGTSLSYLWMNDSSVFNVSSVGVQIGDGGATLTILNVTRYDRGPYTCNVSNPVGDDIGRPLTLTISYGPEQLAIIGPSLAEVGEVMLLYCSATSVPPASYTWSFNGLHTNVQGPVYVIESVTSSDYGKYTCAAINTLTDLSTTADHVVSLKGVCVGESILPTGPLSGAVGGAVKFSTKLEPATRPFITVGWNFNEVNFITYTSTGRDFVDPLYANRVTVDRTTGSMELRGLALVDSGEYVLSITTDEGQQKMGTIVLNVYVLITGASITRPASSILIAGKSVANLTCDATAGSVRTREWMKNGRPLLPSPGRVTFSADAKLLSINPVLSDNHGNYQCRVSNPVGAMTATYNLTVNFGPQNVWIVGPREAPLGRRVLLRCSVDSVPPPTFSWAVNGNKTRVTNSTYIIERMEARHVGNYTCTVNNQVTKLENSTLMNLRVLLNAREIITPLTVVGYTGYDVILPCKLQNKKINLIQMQWDYLVGNISKPILIYHPLLDVVIPNSSLKGRLYLKNSSQDDFSAVIQEVAIADGGQYTCILNTFPNGVVQGKTELVVKGKSL
ncbi:Carcinoembryonic antigen-related cell adhesion molecule 1 [Merluccius polli]|uniref:Carcinoembryonic antigen-related cell adhesion molecule 1 n=1 Tax=Merluccius polli TaxID=89951 RepID=A0AA47MGC5_MERPO|nr:Carcinoembryonic antigen-related cell adhesion molecule 1 [Merluccius polli]